jgi:predicted MFS family arabinose efflux permease
MITNPNHEKRLIATLGLIQFIHILDFMVMMPLGPHFIRSFQINAQHFSYLISAYTVSAGIMGFIGSFFLDRVERKKALLFFLLGFTIGTFFCAVSSGYWWLLISRIVTGAFGGLLGSTILSVLGDSIPAHRRGRAMGIVMMSFSLASVFGVPLGLFLANYFSWPAPFVLVAAVGVVAIGLTWLFVPTLTEHLKSNGDVQRTPVIAALTNQNQRSALLVTTAIMLGQFAIVPLIATFMTTNVGFSEHDLTYLYIFGGLAAMVTAPIGGRIADKYGKFVVFAGFSLFNLIPVFLLTHLTEQPLLIPLLISTALFMSSAGRMVSGTAIIVSSVSARQRGGFMSINTCVQQLGAGIAAFVAGTIVTQLPSGELQHYDWVGYWAMAMAIFAIYLASRVKTVDTSHTPTQIAVAEGDV